MSKPAMTKAAARAHLLDGLATMPDEAFAWLVLACVPSAMLKGGRLQIWPDGIGGFTGASREAIAIVRLAAEAYIDANE